MNRLASRVRSESNARNAARLLVAGLLIVNVALMIWYIFYGYQAGFHSDSAVKVLLAREIVETGEYFPSDWNYGNHDIFVLSGHTFIIPLLAFIPAGFFVHAVSGLVFAAFILSGAWFLTSLFEIGKIRRIAIVAVLASGISGALAENLYGQVSYGIVFFLSCYILFFAYRFLEVGRGWQKHFLAIGLFAFLLLAFWANPQRALIYCALPLLSAIVCYRHSSVNATLKEDSKPLWYLCAIFITGVVLGVVLHTATLSGVNNLMGAASARWLSFDEMMRNVILTLKGFLAIFGGLPSVGGLLVSKSGLYEAMRLTSALLLLVLMPLCLRTALRQKPNGSQFVASYALVAVLLTLFVQFTTTVPSMSDPVSSTRYLVPSLLLLLIIVLTHPCKFTKKPLLALVSTVIAIVFITSAYPTFVRSNLSSVMDWGIPRQHHKHRQKLIDFMLTNGLRYGYATYWNAGVLSVLSDEKVLVRQIGIDRGLPMPMRWLSSNRWYRTSAWQGETFLLLTAKEAEDVKWDLLESYHAMPVRKLNFEEFKIFVFAQNLAKNLPGWDRRHKEPVNFMASKDSMSQVGQFHSNHKNGGGALVAERGEAGVLHYGPYIDVEPGAYTVTFNVSAESAPNGSARLDVAAAAGQKILVEAVLIDNTSPRQLSFTLDELAKLEFRVWSLGNARVVFRDVSIVRNNPSKNDR